MTMTKTNSIMARPPFIEVPSQIPGKPNTVVNTKQIAKIETATARGVDDLVLKGFNGEVLGRVNNELGMTPTDLANQLGGVLDLNA